MRDFVLVTVTTWTLFTTASIASDISAIRNQNDWMMCTMENRITDTYAWCGRSPK